MTAETEQTEQSEHKNKKRTARQDNWNKIVMAGKPVQDSLRDGVGHGQPGDDSWDSTARVTTWTGFAHFS
jgi:hypothetical protein